MAEKVISLAAKGRFGPIARPGYRFIGGGFLVMLVGLWVLAHASPAVPGQSWGGLKTWLLGVGAGWYLTVLGGLMMVFFIYFFRDPERVIPPEKEAIISPADGRVIARETVQEEQFLNQPTQKLSIFMNLFNVHVNRAPVTSQLKGMAYRAGQYIPANRPESPQVNEQQALLLETESGKMVVMVQIAGILARRIVTYVAEGDWVAKGERLGLICFGSRVDLYLPEDCTVSAQVGDRVKAGSSIVGRMS